jgi:excinuclease ABC subunit C
MRPKANKPEPVEIEDHMRTTARQRKCGRQEPDPAALEIHPRAGEDAANQPGVYRMINQRGDVLYVGKARDLEEARHHLMPSPTAWRLRLQRMVSETVAHGIRRHPHRGRGAAAGSQLIKRYMPRYNVLLRDDKSFPYILITGDHPAPQMPSIAARATARRVFRAVRFRRRGQPHHRRPAARLPAAALLGFASSPAARGRVCSSRSSAARRLRRRITEADYRGLVQEAHDFLTGKSDAVKLRLSTEMQQASDALAFETAARLRDRIQALAAIQSRQDINLEGVEEADIIAAHQEESGHSCVQVFFFRNHSNYGSRAYFPAHDRQAEVKDILAAFIGQFYENKTPPRLILVNETPAEAELLTEAMTLRAWTQGRDPGARSAATSARRWTALAECQGRADPAHGGIRLADQLLAAWPSCSRWSSRRSGSRSTTTATSPAPIPMAR